MDARFFRLASRTAMALRAGAGIVALESMLVAQGMPWAENLETARAAEAAVARSGAMSATVAAMEPCQPDAVTD